ncbi:unnamed protein product [Dicrocoelium dendriticum]|nr:unnamed protein product [Dicrocoelium dendriticum]
MSALISMKMSASWDAEKSGSNAVPRLCSLSLAQIILDRPLEPDSPNANFFVAVRMRGSGRRVLRSPEITVAPPKAASPVNGLATPGFVYSMSDSSALPSSGASAGAAGSVLIDFNCSIQYSHLLNRDANVLQILLQRRKKYKNKTMNFGYKTLAYCNVNLAQVLQRRIENRYLELYTDPNCITQSIGRVEVQSLSTVPIEKDLLNGKRKALDEDEEYPLPDTYSEDSDHGEESDDDPIAENDESGHNRQKKLVKAMSMGQKQIKQKLIGLLKKLKMGDPNEEDLDVGENSKLWDEFDLIGTVSDIEEEDSDVDGVDTVSIRSTPKPTLRPFFATAGGGGSDETLSADVGTKLLKRLQRQLFTQSEADTPPDTCLNTVLSPAAGVAQRPIETAPTKKTLPIGGSTQTASFPLATDVRDGRSSLRHHRGSNLSGGRLAKRFAHMGRRSNVSRAEKQATVSATDAFKLSECPTEQKSLTITGAFAVQDPGPSDRQGSPSGNLSHQESSDDSVPARGHHRLKYHGNTEITSSALGDEVLAASVAASSTRRQFPGEPSTPDTHYTGTTPTVPSDLLTTDELSAIGHPAEKFSTCSIDYLGNVLFLVNPLEPGGKLAAEAFSGRDLQLHLVTSYGEMKQLFARLVTKSQSQTRRASDCDVIKLCVLGGDMLVSFALRAYVDQLSSRSPELAAAFRFYIVPITGLINAKPPSLSHIPSVDQTNISQHETRTAMKQNHGTTPTAMRHEFPTSDQSTDSDHHNAVTTFKATSSPVCTHNAVASHLCKIDPAYATLFSDLCASWSPGAVDSSPTATTTTSENLTTWNSHSSAIGLFERTVVYLHKSRSVLPMPIGSCLLGIASSFSSGAKSQKSAEQPASQLTYTAVSGHLDSIVAPSTADGVTKFSSAALNEEMLMPFLISVSLGSDPLPPRTSQMSRPGTGGDPQTFSSPHPINASDLGSVVSDPEGSFAATGTTSAATTTTKRSQSPEATTTVAPSHSHFRHGRFRRAHSTTSSSVNMSLGSRFWDLQLEYWVVPAAAAPLL